MNQYLRWLLIISNLWFFAEGMLGPLYAIFTEKIGGDVLDVAWTQSLYLIVCGSLYIIFGKLLDAFSRKEIFLFLGYLLNTIFTFGYLAVKNPYHLFIVQFGLGVASALATPSWDVFYHRWSDFRSDGLQWGLAEGIPSFVKAFALIIGGYIISFFSFNFLFLVMGLIQLLATFLVLFHFFPKKIKNN